VKDSFTEAVASATLRNLRCILSNWPTQCTNSCFIISLL